jgi:hypothetical protein
MQNRVEVNQRKGIMNLMMPFFSCDTMVVWHYQLTSSVSTGYSIHSFRTPQVDKMDDLVALIYKKEDYLFPSSTFSPPRSPVSSFGSLCTNATCRHAKVACKGTELLFPLGTLLSIHQCSRSPSSYHASRIRSFVRAR